MNHSEIVSFLWGVADLIRAAFRRGKYQDVILPLTILRRLDCVLVPTVKVGPLHEGPTGRDADRIAFGSSLSNDRHAALRFDYLIANPSHGKDWKGDEEAVRADQARGARH